jgi:hypothetical protein
VEVQKRENERQAAQRVKTHTHLREQIDREPATALTMHMLSEGKQVLQGACKSLMQRFSGDVAMGVPPREYLRMISPSTYTPDDIAYAPPICWFLPGSHAIARHKI